MSVKGVSESGDLSDIRDKDISKGDVKKGCHKKKQSLEGVRCRLRKCESSFASHKVIASLTPL